jgi:L-cysteate sulfo-lyase
MKLSTLPRVRLASLPTPLQELPNLSVALKGPRIYVKRDDMTGLAFGGNKTRKLEYLMADAISQDADYIVTGAGFHSNWCTQAAAAARKSGMKVVLVKSGPEDGYEPEDIDGNNLLHHLMGAEIKVAHPENAQKVVEETIEELKDAGHKPYLLRATGSTPPGVMGYVNTILELTSQAVDMGIDVDCLVHASGSGGTQAGLVLGAKMFSTGMKVLGVTTGGRPKEDQIENVSRLVKEAAELLELSVELSPGDVVVYDEYAGGGYGYVSDGKMEAVKLPAETEGLMLDPVYTASAMACLIDLCRKRFFKPEDVVVFLHTGGPAALFPYKEPLKAYLGGEERPWVIPPWSPASE